MRIRGRHVGPLLQPRTHVRYMHETYEEQKKWFAKI